MHLHVPEALAGIVADIKAQKPDHIALTGDLVNVSLPQEFRRAAEWLAAFDAPDRITVIPGNHDVYVADCVGEGMGLWGAYIAGDGEPPAASFDVFPTLRRRDGIALIGLSTGVPKPPLLATGDLGEAQIARAERLLGRDRPRGPLPRRADPSSAAHRPVALEASHRCRCLPGDDPPGRLRGDPARPQSPQRDRAHRRPEGPGAGARRHLGVGGARQQVRPRALSSHAHRA